MLYIRTARRIPAAIFAILFGVAAAFICAQTPPSGPPSPDEPSDARAELNEGVTAYKAARYDEAIAHFQKAADLDPSSRIAKQYLATALAQNVVPGLDTPDNLKLADRAIAEFAQALAADPHDVNSMKQVAAIDFSIKRLDDARTWQKKVLDEDPDDASAAYTIGVIDWTQAHQNVLSALVPLGFNDDGEGNIHASAEALEAIRAHNRPLIDEALQYLQQALADRPDYDDAMAYLNLVYRRKADLELNEEARRDDLEQARDWARKAMETRKAKEAKRNAQPGTLQP